MLNQILNIAIGDFDNNYLLLTEEYEERIFNWHLSGGPGCYANFHFKLSPNHKKEIVVFSDIELESGYINVLGQRINDFVNGLAKDNIGISGFDVYFKKQKFHPVDSHPIAYSIFFIESLDNLIGSNVFKSKTKKPTLSGERYIINGNNQLPMNLPSDDFVSNIFVPRQFEYSIRLNSTYKISPVVEDDIDKMLEYFIYPSTGYKPSKINLIFKANLLSTSDKMRYNKIVNRVVSDLQNESVNVLGFTIYFVSNTHKEFKLKTDEFQRFEWALRNLFNCQDSIQKINEYNR